jgi:hypothetical protein
VSKRIRRTLLYLAESRHQEALDDCIEEVIYEDHGRSLGAEDQSQFVREEDHIQQRLEYSGVQRAQRFAEPFNVASHALIAAARQ